LVLSIHVSALNTYIDSWLSSCELKETFSIFTNNFQTISIIVSFFLAMLHHPEVQIRARAEIDSVTEGNRLPDFEDRPSLPYIELLMAELFRWVTPAPLGMT
jgi:hypothetical protein